MLRFSLSLLLVLTLFSGCGYTTGSLLPAKYRRISVEPFLNKVNNIDENNNILYIPNLETNVRTAIIDRFLFDGNLRIADSDKADLVLTGALLGIAQDTLRQDVNQNVQEYRVRVIVSLTMTDRTTGKVLWTEPSFDGETNYYLSGPQAISQSTAVANALTDLATRVVERTVEDW
jgi:hypothetical protein